MIMQNLEVQLEMHIVDMTNAMDVLSHVAAISSGLQDHVI